jgi:hypothetical protein
MSYMARRITAPRKYRACSDTSVSLRMFPSPTRFRNAVTHVESGFAERTKQSEAWVDPTAKRFAASGGHKRHETESWRPRMRTREDRKPPSQGAGCCRRLWARDGSRRRRHHWSAVRRNVNVGTAQGHGSKFPDILRHCWTFAEIIAPPRKCEYHTTTSSTYERWWS